MSTTIATHPDSPPPPAPPPQPLAGSPYDVPDRPRTLWRDAWSTLKRNKTALFCMGILIAVVIGIGGGTRFYRTVVLEEIYSDYVRTARAKGVSNRDVLFTHVLRNAMIPVITKTVTALPGLILGALLLERIFQIPGLGNMMVEAIGNNDRAVVMGMTYVLAIIYCLLLLVTDLCYALVDPRVRLR